MPIVRLSDRSVITVSGPEAEHLLQNVVTTDLDRLGAGEVKAGALLTPQGKILFDFLIARDGADGFRIDCRSDVADDFMRRLMLYRLRAKAEIGKPVQADVAVSWETDSATSENDSSGLRDSRFRDMPVTRHYSATASGNALDAWTRLRAEHGVAESGDDYALSDAFPHDVLLDQLDGVGFRKGCYVGQEVVSRMQHRGTARRRVMLVSAETLLPLSGTSLTAGGKSIGTLGSVAGDRALAIVRIDRVKDALDAGEPILAEGTPVSLAIPGWATYTLPAAPEAESA